MGCSGWVTLDRNESLGLRDLKIARCQRHRLVASLTSAGSDRSSPAMAGEATVKTEPPWPGPLEWSRDLRIGPRQEARRSICLWLLRLSAATERMSGRTHGPTAARSASPAPGARGWHVIGGSMTPGRGDESACAGAANPPCPLPAVALTIDLDQGAVIHQPVHRLYGHGTGGEDDGGGVTARCSELRSKGHNQNRQDTTLI